MSKITSPIIIDKVSAIIHIDDKKKPVLFWDTCSLLDIVRLPLPDRNQAIDSLEKIIEIKNKIVSKEIVSISSTICIAEFDNHIENWVKSLESESKKLSKTYNNFIEFINKANLGAIPISTTDLSVYKLEDLLCQIVHSIISETLFVSEHATFNEFAHFRTTNKIPPAKKKGEYKDCYVWGTCLEIRQTSVDKSYPYHFMSSNIADYADSSKIEFVTEIKNEATINKIKYFSNFKIAYVQLKRDGIV
jgi:hypothetical protein